MIRLLATAVLVLGSFTAMAQETGFKAGEAPPPPEQQDSGYKGTQDTIRTPVSSLAELRTNGWVTLEGYITRQTGDKQYTLRDQSGTVKLQIAEPAWKGESYDATDLVRISGYKREKDNTVYIDVKEIGEP